MFVRRSASPHASAFSPSSSGHRTLSYFLDQGCRDDVDTKISMFFYAWGMPFNVLHSPYWHEMVQNINGSPKGYRALGMTNLEPWDLTRKDPKSKVL
jgi:hypothetical protein